MISKIDKRRKVKYFCDRCRDQNFLIGCGCGLCDKIILKRNRFGAIINYFYNHHMKGRKGINNPNWKYGRIKIGDYWYLYLPDYFSSNKNQYIGEHVYNFQEYYQCCVLKWAVVHHIDHNKENNMPWNLVGMMESEHTRLHNKGNQCRKGYRKNTNGRKCSNCKSNITYINPKNYKIWHKDGKGGYHCQKCYEKTRPKRTKSKNISSVVI
jgi:hypothetical protein